jgi:hypothetical protein
MFLCYFQKNRVSLAMLVLYAVVIGFFMYHHEMWRDEIEYFLYRKHHGITNPGDPCYLVYNIPANLFLLFGSTLGVYKIYHFFIIVATAALILLCSPFSNIEKFLITFSYYLTYEYGIMSRYYGMFCLLVLLITWVLASRRENYVLLSVLILCLADLNSSGTLFAVCFSLFAAFRVVTGLRSGTIAWKGNSGLKTGLVIMGLGWVALAVFYKLYLLNLAKNLTYGGAVPPLHIAISSLLNAYLPIPDLTKGSSFWSTHLFGYQWCFPEGYSFSWGQITSQEIGCALASLGIFVVIGVAFWRERAVAILYLFNTVLMIGFFRRGMKVFPSRYLGLLFLILVYCYWLFKSSRQKSGDEQTSKSISGGDHTLLGGLRKAFKPLLYVILGSQVIAAVYALGICLNHQFTLSQDAASFIKWNKLQQSHVLVGYPDYAAQCISAHLDQKIFYPQQGRFAYSSGDFLDDFKSSVPASELFGSCLRFTEGEGKKVLLILNFPLMADREHVLAGPALISKNSSIELLQAVTGDVINQDEQFWLYEVAKVP